MRQLEQLLLRIDGRGYKAYKELQGGRFEFPRMSLLVDHVQGDPYATPSRARAVVAWPAAALPEPALASPARRRATRDFLARAFRSAARGERDLTIEAGGQTVLERSACLLTAAGVELRFRVDLPAAGRRILGSRARDLLIERLPQIVAHAAEAGHLDLPALERHCAAVEDQEALRGMLADAGLVAFVGDGSRLPRASGVDDRPLAGAVEFEAPSALRVTLRAPNAGTIAGLGLRRGITLVVGGGFHGKSTLLRAIENGVYDHIPNDGRECVVTDPAAVKIRAEDGRSINGVDISSFIGDLPYGRSTEDFTTDLASGSTSQAAAIQEALEAEAGVLLLDEDTSASNFMIRDRRMQALVDKAREPITPFLDRVRELRDTAGVSTILVMGGSGDYFDHANTVILMNAYRPLDVTARAREIANQLATGRREEHNGDLHRPRPRRLDPKSLSPETKSGKRRIQARGTDTLVFGRSEVDLRAVEQIVDSAQVRSMGWLLAHLARCPGETVAPLAPVREMLARLGGGEWDWLTGHPDGDLALPRLFEVTAALNRLRGVRLR
ncbi:MAG: ABC-ATPase domain-containing protein [Acidobacteria bacterium]|nr:ABC-ATPase domain-containing protein [Acidobacteriota bacterium]